MKPILSCAALLLLAGADPAWQNFTSKEGNYQVSVPGKPQSSEQKLGNLVVYRLVAGLDNDTTFLVYHYDPRIPAAARKMPGLQQKFLDEGGAELLKSMLEIEDKLIEDKKIKLGDQPGREVTAALKDGGKVRVRLYLLNYIVYVQGVVSTNGKGIKDPAADKFLDSFKMTK